MPVMNELSSLVRNRTALATSDGSVRRPKGTFDRNFARFSSVLSTPENLENLVYCQTTTCPLPVLRFVNSQTGAAKQRTDGVDADSVRTVLCSKAFRGLCGRQNCPSASDRSAL